MALNNNIVERRPPERRRRRAAYALPTLFTAGNIFLGYLAILRSFQGAMLAASNTGSASEHFIFAAKCVGAAAFLDGLPTFAAHSAALILPRHRVQDIDTPEDWAEAELMHAALARRQRGEGAV